MHIKNIMARFRDLENWFFNDPRTQLDPLTEQAKANVRASIAQQINDLKPIRFPARLMNAHEQQRANAPILDRKKLLENQLVGFRFRALVEKECEALMMAQASERTQYTMRPSPDAHTHPKATHNFQKSDLKNG